MIVCGASFRIYTVEIRAADNRDEIQLHMVCNVPSPFVLSQLKVRCKVVYNNGYSRGNLALGSFITDLVNPVGHGQLVGFCAGFLWILLGMVSWLAFAPSALPLTEALPIGGHSTLTEAAPLLACQQRACAAVLRLLSHQGPPQVAPLQVCVQQRQQHSEAETLCFLRARR